MANGKAVLDQQREHVQFHQPSIEGGGLELLDVVAIDVIVPAHHRADEIARRAVAFEVSQTHEARVSAHLGHARGEEVHGAARFVALTSLFVQARQQPRRLLEHRGCSSLGVIEEFRPVNPAKALDQIACEKGALVLAIDELTQHQAEQPAIARFVPGVLVYQMHRRPDAAVGSQGLEACAANRLHVQATQEEGAAAKLRRTDRGKRGTDFENITLLPWPGSAEQPGRSRRSQSSL